MRRALATWCLLAFGLAMIVPALAFGHAFQPALLELSERADGRVDVVWKASTRGGEAGRPPAEVLRPELPEQCVEVGERRSIQLSSRRVERWRIDCGPGGLAGREAGVLGLDESAADALVRYRSASGETHTALLDQGDSTFVPPAEQGAESSAATTIAATYLGLGVEHILLGFDHLLFVLGLLLLVRDRRTLVTTITAFTIAHSITLVLSTLGVFALSQSAVEAVIAASLVLLAVEAVRFQNGEEGLTARAPWAVAFGFGLLHGFGFAGALRELGLPQADLPLALASFNVGVELGQLAFVGVWVAGGLVLDRIGRERPAWAPRLAAYVIGVPAAYWMIERVAKIMRI